jgi:hypothetical protein
MMMMSRMLLELISKDESMDSKQAFVQADEHSYLIL